MATVLCGTCSTNLQIPEKAAGTFKCPKCGSLIEAPAHHNGPAESYSAVPPAPKPPETDPKVVCPYCRELIQPGAVKCKHCGETLDRTPSKDREWQHDSSGSPPQPGKVQGIAIMVLIGGILATLIGVGLVLSTCFLWVPGIYSIVLGIMAIIRSVSLFGPNAHQATPPKGIAIMMIINIINADVINLVLGILILVFLNDPQVQDYFSRGRHRSAD